MPRSGWLALGALAAALAGGPLGSAPVLVLACALGAVALALRSAARDAVGWQAIGAFGLGLAAVGCRIALAGILGTGSVPNAVPDGQGPWSATVASVSAPRGGHQSAILRLDPPADVLVAATLPRFPVIVPGDRVRTTGRLRLSGDDDYGRYLARIGVAATLTAAALDRLPAPQDAGRKLEGLRRDSADALAVALPEPEAGLAAGILVGLRDRVDRDLAAAFTTAGVSHVVAISGWNIAIVAAMVGALAGRLRRRRRSVLTMAAIAAYVLFVGASASVLRAAAMAGVALLARESGRPGRAAVALALAVTSLLLVDPDMAADAGFQLSALATAGLVAWASALTARLAGPDPGRLRRLLAENLGVSLAAQAATLPMILVDFGRLSLVAPAVNLAVVPLVAPAMAAGAIALGAGWLVLLGAPAIVATILGLPAWALLALMVAAARAGAAVPFASLTLNGSWPVVAAATSAAVILAVARAGHRVRPAAGWLARRLGALRARRAASSESHVVWASRTRRRSAGRVDRGPRVAGVALLAASATLGLALVHRPDGIARVIVLDVGQGDAILVEGGAGGRLLVDGGPDPDRLLVALDERLPPWDRRIDAVILTHPHEDHVAGLAGLLDRYRVGRVFDPGMEGPGPGYAAWRAALERLGLPHATLAAGDHLRVDDIRLTVLWPIRGTVPLVPADTGTAINNVSIVLLGEVAGRSFLLAGDVEQGVDPQLLTAGLPRVDLLKVAHHGSKTASTDAFLEAVDARVAVVSAGTGNPYGHPAPSTIARLEASGARVLRTDTDGTVEVALDRTRMTVTASGPRAAVGGLARPATATAFTCGLPGLLAGAPADPLATVPALARLPSGG